MNGSLVILPGGTVSSTGAGAEGIVVATTASAEELPAQLRTTERSSRWARARRARRPRHQPRRRLGPFGRCQCDWRYLQCRPDIERRHNCGSVDQRARQRACHRHYHGEGASGAEPVTIGVYQDQDRFRIFLPQSWLHHRHPANRQISPTSPRISIAGTSPTTNVTLSGGIFDSGNISATNSNTDDGYGQYGDRRASHRRQCGRIVFQRYVADDEPDGIGGRARSRPVRSDLSAALLLAVDIGTGSTLSVIDNYGTISASASTTDATIKSLTAEAILDRPARNQLQSAIVGTVTTINNYSTGTIYAVADACVTSGQACTALDNNAQVARAIDLTGSTQNVTVTNNGRLTAISCLVRARTH